VPPTLLKKLIANANIKSIYLNMTPQKAKINTIENSVQSEGMNSQLLTLEE
jgi:hypothetical protein